MKLCTNENFVVDIVLLQCLLIGQNATHKKSIYPEDPVWTSCAR